MADPIDTDAVRAIIASDAIWRPLRAIRDLMHNRSDEDTEDEWSGRIVSPIDEVKAAAHLRAMEADQ